MSNNKPATLAELGRQLEERKATFVNRFQTRKSTLEETIRDNLADLEVGTKEDLAVRYAAVRRFMKVLGEFFGNSYMQNNTYHLRVRCAWFGLPIIQVWDGADIPIEQRKLIYEFWINPEGQIWWATKVDNITAEHLDNANITLHYWKEDPFDYSRVTK